MRFSQTLALARFYLRREWKTALIWIAILVGVALLVAAVFTDLYGTPESRVGMAETMRNPAMVAMVGPVYTSDADYSNAVMYAQMMQLFWAMAAAVLNILMVIRLTRRDEEEGRIELIRSQPVGRLSNLAATMLVCVAINVAFALITGVGLALLHVESMGWGGCLLFGAALGVTGIVYGAIAALFSQIASTSRGAIAYSLAFMGIDYLVRAMGDIADNGLSLFVPLGIILRTEAFFTDAWWPILLVLAIAAVVTALAFWLNARRDLGAGLIAEKPGRSRASRWLKSPLGLALRLLRTTIIAWAVATFVLGASYGSVFGDIETFLAGSEMMQQMFLHNDAFTLAEQFLTTLVVISAIYASIPTIMLIMRLYGEEKKGRLEHIFTKQISRGRVYLTYVAVALVGSVLFMGAFLLGLWAAAASVMADPIPASTVFGAGMSYLPAIWVMVGLAALAIGFKPVLAKAVWVILGVFFFIAYLGRMLNFPDWMLNSTPYGMIPQVPIEDANIWPLIALTALAGMLLAVGYVLYQRRDLVTS